jgi:hypothetical protein
LLIFLSRLDPNPQLAASEKYRQKLARYSGPDFAVMQHRSHFDVIGCCRRADQIKALHKTAASEFSMKLYVTFTSPYARLARFLVLEKHLRTA